MKRDPKRRPPFQVGEQVKGIYSGPRGTTLASGPVLSCEPFPDSPGWLLTARLGGADRTYTLTENGHGHGYVERVQAGQFQAGQFQAGQFQAGQFQAGQEGQR